MDPDELERRIDSEYLATEEFLATHVRGKSQRHAAAQPGKSPRFRARSSSPRPPPAPPAASSHGAAPSSPASAAWRSSTPTKQAPESTSGCRELSRLQARIDELERQVAKAAAEAEVSLSEVERRAAQRKWAKERKAQRQQRGAAERSSATTEGLPLPAAAATPAPAPAPVAADADADADADGVPRGLLAVAASWSLSYSSQSDSADEADEADLASARRAEAALRLQRTQRGHAARALTREQASARQALVDDFLARHGEQWQRTPSANDLQALVLPRLASGSRLGAGSFGCVYQPRKVWHFPRDGIAVKAVSLRSREAASGAALEASLLRRVMATVGTHPNVVTLHGSFVVGAHARLAFELATRGDLHEHLWRLALKREALPRRLALELGAQLAAGLAHLHSADVAHRDLKLSNALLFEAPESAAEASSSSSSSAARHHECRLTLKVADLGLGAHSSTLTPLASLRRSLPPPERDALLGRLRCATRGVSRESCGSTSTMAPEVLDGAWHCPYAADAWSLGSCLLALVAPRELDEWEDRPPFYAFAAADDSDEDFAAFRTCLPPPSSCPPGLGSPRPPGLGSAPPGLASPGLGAPPGLLAPPKLEAGRQASGVAALIERRAELHGQARPEPPLSSALLRLLDGLLAIRADGRMSVAEAALRMMSEL